MFKLIGFTLVELLCVLSLIAILSAVALPYWQHFTLINQTTVIMNRFIHAIQLARSEAVKRGIVVGFCASDGVTGCSNDWEKGQIVFLDRTHDGVLHDVADILYQFPPIKNVKIHWQVFGNQLALQMRPNGSSNFQNGSFIFCPSNHDAHFAHAILLNKLGRARLSRDADHDGIDEGADELPLTCIENS